MNGILSCCCFLLGQFVRIFAVLSTETCVKKDWVLEEQHEINTMDCSCLPTTMTMFGLCLSRPLSDLPLSVKWEKVTLETSKYGKSQVDILGLEVWKWGIRFLLRSIIE